MHTASKDPRKPLPGWLDRLSARQAWIAIFGAYALGALLIAAVLCGCGGGGEEDAPPLAPTPAIGQPTTTIGTPNCAASGVCS